MGWARKLNNKYYVFTSSGLGRECRSWFRSVRKFNCVSIVVCFLVVPSSKISQKFIWIAKIFRWWYFHESWTEFVAITWKDLNFCKIIKNHPASTVTKFWIFPNQSIPSWKRLFFICKAFLISSDERNLNIVTSTIQIIVYF